MKTQWTTQYNRIVALLVIALCSSLWADGGSFLDDFSDGSVKDGSPVTWGWDDDGTGERLVDSEGLHLTPEASYVTLLDEQGNSAIYEGDMTIRMQLRMLTPGNTGIFFRAQNPTESYMAGIYLNQLYLGRKIPPEWKILSQPTIPGFSPTQQDIIIQIDVTDSTDNAGQRTSQLKVYAWFPGQDKPAQPQISATDNTYAGGEIALYADQCSAIYRWVEIDANPGPAVEPVIDFNGDGQVDIKDLVRMIESWGTADPAIDIAPLMMQDGLVDILDLETMMTYWQQDVNDPTLGSHWTLDETEGNQAYDSVGEQDAVVLGDAEWLPELGQVHGALLLDGIDDSVLIPAVLNPAEGPFSVVAWIKGGAPGQVILSQAYASNWLMVDAETGGLRTNLTDPVRAAQNGTEGGLPLISTAVITDGAWHRVALVWDGLYRILYVDDQEVAHDIIDTPESVPAGLYMGGGHTLASGSLWSGQIDDVRIYHRAITP